jgi:protein-tyrosine phosphatase
MAPEIPGTVLEPPEKHMIDLHTHLLPDWDDGAKDWEETASMARIAREDGITKVGLTPHVDRLTKHGDSLELLEQRFDELRRRAIRFPVVFFRGAEVYVTDRVVENIKRDNLTVNNSCYVFLEFPADSVIPGVRDLFYQIMLQGHVPIISHPERNVAFARQPGLLYDLVNMGAFAQVTAKSILGEFGREAREAAKVYLKHNLVHIIASDAHNVRDRPPLLRRAVEKAAKIVGREKALAMVTEIPQAILDNEAIPKCGEPVDPEKGRKWGFA